MSDRGTNVTAELENTSGSVINPATEEKQDSIITALSGSNDFYFNVENGDITGLSATQVAANNPGLSQNTKQNVNHIRLETGTGAIYTYLTADTTVFVSSSSASDTQTIAITGLDAAYTEVLRTVTLNGQTPVAFSGTIFRIFSAFVISSPIVAAVGNIYVSTDNTDITNGVPNTLSKVVAKIDTDFIRGNTGAHTIPLNKKGYLFNLILNSSKASDAEIFVRIRTDASNAFNLSPPFQIFESGNVLNEIIGTNLPAKTDIDIIAVTPTPNSKITAAFSLIFTDV